jgi:heme/copper-type cytochrome/quinol oxidase subunit 2
MGWLLRVLPGLAAAAAEWAADAHQQAQIQKQLEQIQRLQSLVAILLIISGVLLVLTITTFCALRQRQRDDARMRIGRSPS